MSLGIVSTIGQKCKRCYSCIRECPAKAIRVENGQAVVIQERCINCGHCVKVCSQNAKAILSDIEKVENEILPAGDSYVIVAPAFAASYPNDYKRFPTALKKLGFGKVIETAFGADLISPEYAKYFEVNKDKTIISSSCPAIYNYIEKFFPELVDEIAPIVSPMIATGRYIKENYGKDKKVVFVGPCVAKKSEYVDFEVSGAIDAVLTFTELNEMFATHEIKFDELNESDFDPPHAYLGKSFPLSGGLLKTSTISNDILTKNVIVVDGKSQVQEIIHDIADKKINKKFIDILFCKGCINGPAIESDLNYYSRREKVINYIEEKMPNVDKNVWKSEIYNSRGINLSRSFSEKKQRKPAPSEEKIIEILAKSNKFEKKDELNCGACGYHTCREYAIAIAKGLAEEDMCLPFLIEKLELAYSELKETQDQLHSAEKLASIGQLAAGVAHEINNPLGTILLYASMLKREVEKKKEEAQSSEDLSMIIEEANRCKGIVANLLNFARQGKLRIGNVILNEVIVSVVKATRKNPQFCDIQIIVNDLSGNLSIEADHDQVKQVMINLITNACEAMEDSEKKELRIKLSVETDYLIIEIADSGCGVPEENINKLFTPFFTTKKMGKGTGLGLAITYGIIKMHKGDITVKSVINEGTIFKIKLPKKISRN